MKGILSVLLIGLIVLTLGVACGGESVTEPTPQPPSPAPPPPASSPIVSERSPTLVVESTQPSDQMGDVARGMDLANKQGCLGCHTVDGTTLLGPTWKGLFGKDDELEDGSTVTVDEAYIAESIKDPGAKLAKGFSNIMPAFGQLAQEDIDAIIAYIRSLK